MCSLQVELGDNKLSDGLEHLQGCPLITTVNLVGNRISSVDQLKPLVSNIVSNVIELFNIVIVDLQYYQLPY